VAANRAPENLTSTRRHFRAANHNLLAINTTVFWHACCEGVYRSAMQFGRLVRFNLRPALKKSRRETYGQANRQIVDR